MTASGATFGVLGPLEVRIQGRKVTPPGRVVRRLFAALLLSVDQQVEDELLVAWTWGPQRAARGALHTTAYRLRSWLADEASLPEPLVHDPSGYRLNVPPDAVDAGRFRTLVRTAADRVDAAGQVGDLEAALALWRGPVLADLPDWTRDHPEIAALERERVAACCALADAAVATGQPSESTVRAMAQLAGDLPYDEAVQARWLLLLGARGQRAEALRHYETLRARLAEDLGVDPSAVLRDAHLALLADPEKPAPGPTSATGRPRMLPRGIADFTGRSEQVERLVALGAAPTPDRVVVIDGMAGVGKTTMAVHVAHRLESAYPDGAIFVDLHGFTAGREPVDPAAALHSLLREVGVPDERIPDELECRAALWRSELAERRLVVVLDNAASAPQVRPMLPGPTSSLTLVTSRRRLTGLDDAEVFSLDPLDPDTATDLFASVVGRRAADEPEAVRDVVTICGRLPLAIRIAAVRLVHRPSWRVADLASRLRDEDRRLAELAAEDRSVAAAFSLSYRELTTEQQRAFRLLGLVPGQDLDAQAAAALLSTSVMSAAGTLDELVDTHLLQEPTPGRFRFHDLVRQHAADAATDEPHDERDKAFRRLLDYYVHAAEGAADLLEPIKLRTDPHDVPAPTWWLPVSDVAEALTWLTTEFDNVVAAAHRAGADGLSTHAWQLVQAVTALCRHRGQFSEGVALNEFAATMARQQEDRLREGITHHFLAGTYWTHGRTKESFIHCQAAISLFQAIGDRDRESLATGNLGALHYLFGDYESALHCFRGALSKDRAAGDFRGQAIYLANIGCILTRLGDHNQALQHQRRALDVLRHVDDPWVEAGTHSDLGSIAWGLGRYEEAKSHYEAALDRLETVPDPTVEGACLGGLGVIHAHLGQHDQALRLSQQGLILLREADAKAELAALLNDTGRLYDESGDPVQAVDALQEALAIAREVCIPYEEARALEGLATVSAHAGDQPEALDRWQRAREIFDGLGVPDADRVARRLTEAAG
jgi:DNA-binding SARP family transcriptional activator/tetratricopeptide (TPR) repeat protein